MTKKYSIEDRVRPRAKKKTPFGFVSDKTDGYDDLSPWAKSLYNQCYRNACRRGIGFFLTKQQYADIVASSRGRCAISGIEFDLTAANGVKRPLFPSIDRKDSTGRYEYGNVRLVCVAVNLAMHTWGEGLFACIVSATYKFQNMGLK